MTYFKTRKKSNLLNTHRREFNSSIHFIMKKMVIRTHLRQLQTIDSKIETP
ncbi:unnamed protein product [Larinioides sclopetarius]|uniref:Ribosomal protein L20 n=1 Tax=Larinioides sclopetarius TaxID=280406 RepID=A0AAV2BBI5_9ARAC